MTEGTVHTCASRAQETPKDQDPRSFMCRARALGSPRLHSVLSSPIIFISFSSSTVLFISYIHHAFPFSSPCPLAWCWPGSPHPGWTNPPSLSREEPAWGLVGSMAPTAGAVPSGREQRKFGTGRSKRPGRAANTATVLVCLCVN